MDPDGARDVDTSWPVRVVDVSKFDLAATERAAFELLRAIGADPDLPELRETPRRVAASFAELLDPAELGATLFPSEGRYDELVVVREIPFHALCMHHLLPFHGTATVAYIPGERIIGLSKLARVVSHFAARPQVQERLTKQVAGWLHDNLQPAGVGVVIEAEHTCMTVRGIRAAGSVTVTSTLLGTVRDDPRSRQEFFALAQSGA
jgi:GTP cyclohydrolase I